MDTHTGKLYDSYEDGEEDLRSQGIADAEIKRRLHPLDGDEYMEYSSMNRKERRKAAALARKKKNRRVNATK